MNSNTSIDPNELDYYERLAGQWWDPSGPFWPLHRLNRLRSDYIRQLLVRELEPSAPAETPLRDLRILDLGCGGGLLSEAMAELGADVHGVDVVARNLRVADAHAQDRGLPIRYETASAEMLAGRQASYDVVLNMEVVEHVAELPLFLDACMKLVRPGGLIVIATINRTLASWLGAIVMAEHVLRWLPKGTHRWDRFRKPVEIENLLESGGFKVIARTGVSVNPIGARFRLSPYMGINYMLAARRQGG